jgi:hypothetical protein
LQTAQSARPRKSGFTLHQYSTFDTVNLYRSEPSFLDTLKLLGVF